MILDGSNLNSGHTFRRHLCLVGRANDSAGSLRMEQAIGPSGAAIVSLGLGCVEVSERFCRS
jgi:hypothetical protein